MFNIIVSASKTSGASRGIENFYKSNPSATEDDFSDMVNDVINFAGNDFEKLLTFEVKLKKVD